MKLSYPPRPLFKQEHSLHEPAVMSKNNSQPRFEMSRLCFSVFQGKFGATAVTNVEMTDSFSPPANEHTMLPAAANVVNTFYGTFIFYNNY